MTTMTTAVEHCIMITEVLLPAGRPLRARSACAVGSPRSSRPARRSAGDPPRWAVLLPDGRS